MTLTSYKGLDYSLGQSNVNKLTGIHYGVIGQNSIMPEAFDDFEQYYGEPTCPVCGNDATDATKYFETHPDGDDLPNYSSHGCDDYVCETCQHCLDSEYVYSEESLGFTYEREGYKLTDCLDSDVFILDSPYYTFAQFCSPCVPGAGNLDNPCDDGPKTYCLGSDWFEDSKAPYRVFRVSDNSEVL
jgi:hypothetical protein